MLYCLDSTPSTASLNGKIVLSPPNIFFNDEDYLSRSSSNTIIFFSKKNPLHCLVVNLGTSTFCDSEEKAQHHLPTPPKHLLPTSQTTPSDQSIHTPTPTNHTLEPRRRSQPALIRLHAIRPRTSIVSHRGKAPFALCWILLPTHGLLGPDGQRYLHGREKSVHVSADACDRRGGSVVEGRVILFRED